MRPVCVKCCMEMRCEKNEVRVSGANKRWQSSGDMFNCPVCNTKIVVHFGVPFDSVMDPNITLKGDR